MADHDFVSKEYFDFKNNLPKVREPATFCFHCNSQVPNSIHNDPAGHVDSFHQGFFRRGLYYELRYYDENHGWKYQYCKIGGDRLPSTTRFYYEDESKAPKVQ